MVELRTVLSTRDVPVRRTEINDEGKRTHDLILGTLAGPVYTSGAGGLEMWLASECCDPQSFPSVFSAMAESSALIKLDALASPDGDEESNREWLQWLTFAFFSRFSRSSIKNLVIRDCFSMEDVTAISDVVNAANPLSVLLELSESVCRVVELSEDVMLAQPGARKSVSVCGGTTVWVVHDRRESAMVDVLVPGYGVQSIDRSKIREEGSSRLSAGISCLVLRFDADDEDVSTSALIPLLKVVGNNLKQLRILLDVESEVDSCRIELCDILRASPRLEVLKIQGLHVTDISQLSGYMDNNDCALSVLEFNKIERDSDDKIEDFLKALEDSSKRVSQQLRELLIEPRNSAISSTLQHGVQKMLEANRTLGLFVLGVSPKHHSAYERALTQALPTVYLPVVHKSFPLRSKLGFISVVHAPCNGSHALSRLDSRALSSIFRLAALPQKRAVHVFRSDRAYESGSE